MSVHEMQKANRVKKTKAQKTIDTERLFDAFHKEHDALATFCDDIWQYEWHVERMSVEDYTNLMEARENVCIARRILDEEFVADTYRNDKTGEYSGDNVTLRTAYDNV